MSDVQIVVTDELPPTVPYAGEFGPGFIHLAIRPDVDANKTIADALATIIDCYPLEQLRQLSPNCPPDLRSA